MHACMHIINLQTHTPTNAYTHAHAHIHTHLISNAAKVFLPQHAALEIFLNKSMQMTEGIHRPS